MATVKGWAERFRRRRWWWRRLLLLSRDEGSAGTRLNQQEFYAWAYGDLFTNTTRGVLAEYIVATALGITETTRSEWNQYDLQFGDVGVEVKSAAYVQAWKQARPSDISFSIRPARGWDPHTEAFADTAQRSAKVYVFCVLEGKDKASIDPHDVAHWTFYVLATSELERHVGGQTTIRLGRLIQIGAQPCAYDGLEAAVVAAAENRGGDALTTQSPST